MMKRMETIILAPTDFSLNSRKNIEQALARLQKTNKLTQIILLNTYLLPHDGSDDYIKIHDTLKQKSLKRLEALREEIEKNNTNTNISFTTLSHMGTQENVIEHLMKTQRIDQVIPKKIWNEPQILPDWRSG